MSKSLQACRFKWLDHAKFNLDKYDDDKYYVISSLRGCILEINLEYPKE